VIFGRTAGWAFVVLAILMASAEAVMALGTVAYSALATSDVWTLLVGQTPTFALQNESTPMMAMVGALIMAMPAWVAFCFTGFVLLHVCRKRRARRRVLRSTAFN
jgi:hypothetical protein